jgi:hypothetical protein
MITSLYLIQFVDLKKIEINSLVRNLVVESSLIVDYEYGECKIQQCGKGICAMEPNAICITEVNKNISQSENKVCECSPGYLTFKEDEIFACCYKQYNAMTALLLEFFLGFGIGHFYAGKYFLGGIKFGIYFILGFSNLLILIRMFKKDENRQKTLMFKVGSTMCLLLCTCIYIGWQIVDAILFSIGAYTDGNGAPLFIS